MAAAIARKTPVRLISKNCSPFLPKSHICFSLYFSTDSGKRPPNPSKLSELLINKHHFSPQSAAQVASVATRLENLETADSVLSFLKETGFSNSQLERTVKLSPHVLSASLERTVKPKIKIFQDFGFSADEMAEIFSKQALIFVCSSNRLISSLWVLRGTLIRSNTELVKILRSRGWFLKDLDTTLIPNVEFLKSCGVPFEQMIRLMKYPRFFLIKPDIMRNLVEKAEKWEADLLRVLRNVPTAFALSEKRLKNVTEVLLETGKYSMSCIIDNPSALIYSIEKRYKPRLQVLSILEKKDLIQRWPS
ncbi:hypothetical protein C2S52_022704 [Perilla frutescens var. hirtella]|nr:hypothetical protein C2S52_022704 [Perilla frutescens var. hirtella]